MVTILKPRDLKANLGGVLDRAVHRPQYVLRNGQLLIITKAELVPARKDAPLSPWELRASAIDSFYNPAKAW